MSKKLFGFISIMLIAVFVLAACKPAAPAAPKVDEPVNLVFWTKEGEADGAFQYVKALTDAFTAENPLITFEVVNKEVETLREDFQTSSLAGNPPDLLWTVNDHAGPFVAADLIQPVDDLFDLSKFVPSVVMDEKTWGLPISSGNHLMLIYNKDLVPTVPVNTDELVSMGTTLTTGDQFGLVYNQTEPFWMVPWLGGFGGSVFAADGVTPTLNTPEMVKTLQWLYDIKYTTPIVPIESDYDTADTLFKEGKAGMIVNGDWSLSGYQETLGDKMGVAPIPQIVGAGWPAPYTSGAYFMLPKDLSGAKLDAAILFINFVTNEANELKQLDELKRLPSLLSVLDNDKIKTDPILKGSADQMSKGVPMPSSLEMRCNWDAMKPEMLAVLSKTKAPAQAAVDMQAAADACVKTLE
jgi:arabinogalactan oligomer/maltooligosaccharide transport system substrate-binding protein